MHSETSTVNADGQIESSSAGVGCDESTPISKSAMKKAARRERMAAHKLERRAKEKEAKKEKKRIRAEKRAAGELDDADEDNNRPKKIQRLVRFGARVVIDLGFDEKMSEKEIASLTSQLAYTYSANRNASYPFSLLCTSLNGRTYDRLESLGNASYKRWSNTKWWSRDYQALWLRTQQGLSEPRDDPEVEEASATKQDVVYLTADSEAELTELRPQETYILGGIVDRNRYKNLCLEKANRQGIRTARLPIGRYLSHLPTRKVLTVNQVFEIMLRWVETRDWEEALYSVIPKRKFQGKTLAKGELQVANGDVMEDKVEVVYSEPSDGDVGKSEAQ